MYALTEETRSRLRTQPRCHPPGVKLTPPSRGARWRLEQSHDVSKRGLEQRDEMLRRRLERQQLATEGWRDVFGIAFVAGIVCWLASALLMGFQHPLTEAVAVLAGVTVALLIFPTLDGYFRWREVRRKIRRERRPGAPLR